MPVLKRRYRAVTFRVSVEEYDSFANACVASGARSISDFARAAVLHKVHTLDAPAGTLTGDLATLSATLRELDVALREVSLRIHAVLGDVAGETRTAIGIRNRV